MIKLHQFAPAFGLPNASPFCMKVETYLRMAGLPYELVNSGDIFRAPKKKLPFIDDGGELVADSSFIIDHLKSRHGDPLDGGLWALDRAVGTAFLCCDVASCCMGDDFLDVRLYAAWIFLITGCDQRDDVTFSGLISFPKFRRLHQGMLEFLMQRQCYKPVISLPFRFARLCFC